MIGQYDSYEKMNNLKKILSVNPSIKFNVGNRHIINSLDDVFDNFDALVNSHSYYALSNIDVKSYLNSNFKVALNDALKNGNYFVVTDICFKVAKALSPRNKGFFRRKKDEYSLGYALKSLIEQYELSKI